MTIVNSSNSSKGEGNTKPPPKQESPKKRYCLTLNNYTENEYNLILDFFSSNSSNKYIIGKEVGENGTPHLQIYINFSTKIRFSALKKLNDRLHIEVCKGTELDNLKYCSKENNYHTNCRIPKPLKLLKEKDFYEYQNDIINLLKKEPDDRHLIWCQGTKNIGKTQLLRYICANMFACILPTSQKHAQSQIHKTHEDVDIYVFNLTADESIYQRHELFSTIESIKDGLFSSSFGTDTNGMCIFNPKHVLVMANESPDLSKTNIDIERFLNYDIIDKKLVINEL